MHRRYFFMKTPYIVFNFKMAPHKKKEAQTLFREMAKWSRASRTLNMVVCPPFPFLALAEHKIGRAHLGAQTLAHDTEHAHTGEVSALMLKEFGVRFVILGHSERRALGEQNSIIAKKIRRALERNIRPIVCVGEHERTSEGDYLTVIAEEVEAALASLKPEEVSRLLFAYEPIWAIGKGASSALSPEELHQTVLFIRKIIADLFSRDIAEKIPILYGGAVKAENARAIILKGHTDGLLVGSASVDREALRDIIQHLHMKK